MKQALGLSVQGSKREVGKTLIPVRILYVEGCRDGTVGGSHISLFSMLANLDRTRFHPLVVFYADHYIAKRIRGLTGDVYTFANEVPLDITCMLGRISPSLRMLSPLLVPLQKVVNFGWFFLRPAVRYAWFLKSKSIDIVHLNNSINTNHDWMLAAKLARVRLVSHERGISENLSRSSRLLGSSADALVCISSKIRETLLRHGLSADKVVVVHNGIDIVRVRPAQEPERVKSLHGIAGGDPVIGVVGNIKRWKGQEVAVRATAILTRSWPGIRLLLVGGASEDDPYMTHLKEVIRELCVERNVIFTGFQENPADYINAMDVVVHASIEPEPFGRVNIEAMFLNKPVVSTNIGGPTEIFEDGSNGFLIDPGQPDLLAEKLSMLLRDPELRQRIGQHAHETVMERFTITRTVREIEGVYERLLHQ